MHEDEFLNKRLDPEAVQAALEDGADLETMAAYAEYNEALRVLWRALEAGAITEERFNADLDALQKALEELSAADQSSRQQKRLHPELEEDL